MNVFLTGATGFVGLALLNRFVADGCAVTALVRNASVELPDGVKQVVGDLGDLSGLQIAGQACNDTLLADLSGCDVVVHAAARAHIMRDEVNDPLAEYRKVNCDATLALARLAAQAGVRRFVFVSSIGVNGKQNTRPFTENDVPDPHDAYSLSKYEAEQGLLQIAKEIDMEVVIIRPPLVYGANAPGNFGSLVKWVRKGVPLPLGAVHNQRSLVALENLVDFIALCADSARSPKAANEVFLIADGVDVSTSDLLRKVAKACGVKSRLLPVPVGVMSFAAGLLGKRAVADRLFGNLQVDSSKAQNLLGWKPVVTMDEQLEKIAKEYNS
ncbi:NAD-dependent epimerase/dehydratase family protein [Thiomicrorhabdus aquaedulcis]|uniref:NAD-dependent epimerase/dehydratase family protein n=1 Tax=Thiomicrorhabdus aquaedulcis TaxID=2211106 RepID=UPI000FDBB662|nr:NAD-dependent epimerase/dehydratase family protein [Thiomicrorhabdus aquaedulcis]